MTEPKNHSCGLTALSGQLHPETQLLTSQPGLGIIDCRGGEMLWTIIAILIILWLLGWGFHVAGSLIHLLLVIALMVVVINLWMGRRRV